MAGDTLTINWGSQTVTYTLLAGDISGNSATVTVPLATITAQGQGTFNVTAGLTDAVGNAGANSSATSVTVDTVAPTAPSITSIAENSGGGINAAEASDGTPVVVGLTGTGAVAGDTLTVIWGGQTVAYTLLAGDISGNSATVTVPAGTITAQGNGTFNVTAALTDAAGNSSANSSATSVTVDTVAPGAPSITAIPENGGGGINAAEASNGTPVMVGLAGTGAVAGDTLTINWGGQTVTYTLLAADIAGNSATVTVPARDDLGAGPGHVQRDGRADRHSRQCRRQLDGDPGDGRHGGADGGGSHHGDCHRQRHLVERLCHQRHDADGVGHARRARRRREGAGQQRRRRHLVRCHQHGQHLELYRSHAARHELHLPGADRRHRGQCRCQHRQPGGDHRHGGAECAVDHRVPENSGGGINAAEASDGTPVVVGLAGTGAAAGDTLTINWGSQTVTYTLLAADISGSSATVTVPVGTIAAQGNGTFNVTAGLTDVAGNVGPNSGAFPVTVDTAAPTAAVAITAIATDSGTSSSDFVTNDTTLTVSGTHGALGAGETVQVSSDGGATWADVTTSTASTWSYTDPTPHVTSFTYQVRIVDAVGNVDANTASQAVTIDTVAPNAPSITAIPENAGGGIDAAEASDGTPVVVGLAGTGAVAGDTLTINWGSQTVTYTLLAADISGNSATVTVPLATITAQGQGTFNVTARLTDIAGNVGANSTATPVTVDATAPTAAVAITAIATDSGTSSSDFVTNDTTLTVSGTHGALGAGERVQVSSDGGASWFDATSTASTWSYTDPTPHVTSFTYQVRIVDTVGNVGANTASQAVTIDTATPTAPSITAIPENGGGGINAAEASDGTAVVVGLAGTGAAAGDTLTINWGSQTVNYTLLAADISGNSATVTVPLATIAAQGQGTFNVTARLTDIAGNVGANSSATPVTVDAAAPTATVAITAIATDSGTSSSDFITNDTTLTVSGTHGALGAGEKVQVSSDGGASWFDVTSTASTWSYADPTLHGTSFTYQVRIVDTAGNVGANTASQAVTIDTAAPTAAVAITAIATDSGTSSSDFVTNDTTLTVSGTHGALGADESVQVSSDGGANWANATSTASTWSYTDPTAHGTSFVYQVRIVDAAGNLDANTASQAVTIDTATPAAPSITAIPEKRRRRHRPRRGLGRHAGGGRPGGHRGGGGRQADHQLGWPDGQLHPPGGRHLGQQRDGDGAGRDDRGAGPGHIRRDGQADRHSGQCQRHLDGDLGNFGRRWCHRGQRLRSRRLPPTAAPRRATLSPTTPGWRSPARTACSVPARQCRSAATAAPTGSMPPPARQHLELYRSHAARHQLHLPGAGRRQLAQCRCQHSQPGGDHRHGGAECTVDHCDPGECRRRHRRRRGLGRHVSGGRPRGHRGGGGRHAGHQLGQPDGQLHAAGGRHFGQ